MDRYNVVVAHYQEDLSWLSKQIEDSTYYVYTKYYDKDDQFFKKFAFQDAVFTNLENVGREAHTYLYHIIDKYEEISETPESVTAFIKGDVSDHISNYNVPTPESLVPKILKEADKYGYSKSGLIAWTDDINNDTTFNKWFETDVLNNKPKEDNLEWYIGGIFAVKHTEITNKPKSYYINLLLQTNKEIVYFMERAWKQIVTK
jgi:hypothetical protein